MGWPGTEGTGAFPRREPEWITPSGPWCMQWLTFCGDVWTRRPPPWVLVAETHVETAPPDRRRHLQVAIASGQAAWAQMPPSKLTPFLSARWARRAVSASLRRAVYLIRARATKGSPRPERLHSGLIAERRG